MLYPFLKSREGGALHDAGDQHFVLLLAHLLYGIHYYNIMGVRVQACTVDWGNKLHCGLACPATPAVVSICSTYLAQLLPSCACLPYTVDLETFV